LTAYSTPLARCLARMIVEKAPAAMGPTTLTPRDASAAFVDRGLVVAVVAAPTALELDAKGAEFLLLAPLDDEEGRELVVGGSRREEAAGGSSLCESRLPVCFCDSGLVVRDSSSRLSAAARRWRKAMAACRESGLVNAVSFSDTVALARGMAIAPAGRWLGEGVVSSKRYPDTRYFEKKFGISFLQQTSRHSFFLRLAALAPHDAVGWERPPQARAKKPCGKERRSRDGLIWCAAARAKHLQCRG
jgi:hypothetical protein